jgi:hypothetical protein
MVLDGIRNNAVQRQMPVDQQLSPVQRSPLSSPAYLVNISQEAKALAANGKERNVSADGVSRNGPAAGPQECQTCNNRKYVDRSNDAAVTFKAPTRLSPAVAETAVRSHEQEHVSNGQAKASEQGQKVVSQTVTIHYAICPECGSSYVSGGTTTTVTRAEAQPEANPFGSSPSSSTRGAVDLRV